MCELVGPPQNNAPWTVTCASKTKVDKSDLGYAWAIRGDGVGSMVPIPAAAWLFGSGLLGLLAVKRRR